jgi:hypothetical protein
MPSGTQWCLPFTTWPVFTRLKSTWPWRSPRHDVAGMNAKHAHEHAVVDRQGTLELLRSNSHAAAEPVRALSDEQLDSAAPVSLNSDAPLTTQFMIEDHALRHSWHHLAKMKAVLQGI